ncbi:HlyD family efflux transporter periplasmic adaptor subunit [Alteromonadaceae bacterium M269]|nr:HlyD family efflux transporter periplasmic adaptor subunit [Alteromonadaceae bacterium M269]
MNRHRILEGKILVSLLLIITAIVGLYWFVALNRVITVDNAQLKARLTTVRSSVNGLVEYSAVEKIRNRVDQGSVIVDLNTDLIAEEINATRYQITKLEKAIEYIKTEKELYLNGIQINKDDAILQRNIIQSEIARNEFELNKSNELLVSLDHIIEQEALAKKDIHDMEIENRKRKAEQEIQSLTLRQLNNTLKNLDNEKEKSILFNQREEELISEREALLSKLKILEYKITRYTYNTPFAGVINEVFVNDGEYVLEGQRLYILHAPESIYLEAKFYESDFSHLELGKEVSVTLDAYPNETITGVISKVGALTDGQLNVLPSSKITSNFIRIRQYVPVRIELKETDLSIIPGLMATVKLEK